MPRPTITARPRRAAALSLTAGALLVLSPAGATPAFAQGCVGQAGTSALEQYCEAIPRGDGGRDTPGGNGGKDSGDTISKRTQSALDEAGGDGAAVRRLTDDGSAPASPAGEKKTGASGTGSDSADAGAVKGVKIEGPTDPDGSPLSAATGAVQSGPTAGPALAWGIVGMSAIGAIAALMLRRRGSTAPVDES